MQSTVFQNKRILFICRETYSKPLWFLARDLAKENTVGALLSDRKLHDDLVKTVHSADSLFRVILHDGLDVNVDIPEAAMSRAVVPCCVQLLVENAIKHNIIRADEPLQISIRVEDDNVVVSNNRIPKLTKPVSTGLGLKYIRQQYQDLAGKSVTILEEERRYTVKIPLL